MIKKVWKMGKSVVLALPSGVVKAKGIKPGDYVSIPDDQITRLDVPPDKESDE